MAASKPTSIKASLAFSVVGIALGTLQASACFICDKSVTLDEASVACLEKNAERFIAAAKAAPDQRTEVNFGICEDQRGIDGFPTVQSLAEGQIDKEPDNVPKVYFLALASIECLAANPPNVPKGGTIKVDLASECS